MYFEHCALKYEVVQGCAHSIQGRVLNHETCLVLTNSKMACNSVANLKKHHHCCVV